MSKPQLLLIGAGGHALACIEVIESEARFSIAGLVGVAQDVGKSRLGYAVLESDDALPTLAEKYKYALISVGQIKSPARRKELYQRALDFGFQLPAIIAPSARVSRHASIGPGTIVMHGAVVNAGAVVGSNCILNTCSIVEHEAVIGDCCHIATTAVVNGSSHVGEGSFLGSGSIVREGLRLGAECVVGMGVCVRHDLNDGARFTGRDK